MKAVSLWAKMDAEAQKLMKDSLLQALVREPQYALLPTTAAAQPWRDMALMLCACVGFVCVCVLVRYTESR